MILSQPINYVLDIMLPPNQEGQNIAAMMFQATYWLHPFLQYLTNIQLTPIWWNPNSTNMYLVVSCHMTISICLVFISLLWCQIVLSFFFSFLYPIILHFLFWEKYDTWDLSFGSFHFYFFILAYGNGCLEISFIFFFLSI